ncbi:MAG TPA: thermonuclease family protein [Reyranella sp.]|jgi:endonuclease YncB( thermonuclease family)|nr:thermonuclease family protein [Reyranella sp.]
MIRKAISLGIVAGLVLGQPAAAQTVVDGDTIELKGTTFRLHGIDAPELPQVCADGWPAGRAARDYLGDLIGTKQVTCTTRMGEFDHEIAAICRADGIDLGAAMVTGGHALAFVPYSARYITQEDAATSARRGVHGHKCAAPWQWRRGQD